MCVCEVLRMVQGSKARLKSGLPAVEQAGPLLVLASLAKNSDGIICPEELALYREEGQRMVDNTLAQLLNLGVVAALLMSIVYPMAWEMVECADDSPFPGCAPAGCGRRPCWTASSMQVMPAFKAMLAISLMILYCCARMYASIAFWMPTLRSAPLVYAV